MMSERRGGSRRTKRGGEKRSARATVVFEASSTRKMNSRPPLLFPLPRVLWCGLWCVVLAVVLVVCGASVLHDFASQKSHFRDKSFFGRSRSRHARSLRDAGVGAGGLGWGGMQAPPSLEVSPKSERKNRTRSSSDMRPPVFQGGCM